MADTTQLTQYEVQYLITQSIKKGIITKKLICENCGKTSCKIDGHHEDYQQPFSIVWLCVGCHQKIHAYGVSKAYSTLPRD